MPDPLRSGLHSIRDWAILILRDTFEEGMETQPRYYFYVVMFIPYLRCMPFGCGILIQCFVHFFCTGVILLLTSVELI